MRLHIAALIIFLLCLQSINSFRSALRRQGKPLNKINPVSLSDAANTENVIFQVSLYFITGYLVITANRSIMKDTYNSINATLDKRYEERDKEIDVAFGKLSKDMKEMESNVRMYIAVTVIAFTAYECFNARYGEWYDRGICINSYVFISSDD